MIEADKLVTVILRHGPCKTLALAINYPSYPKSIPFLLLLPFFIRQEQKEK
jgi:hypothetical protein